MVTRTRSQSERPVYHPQRHQPAVPVLLAVSAGIIADWYAGQSARFWIMSAVVCFAFWLVAYLRAWPRSSSALLLLACALTGAAAHHHSWSLVDANELLAYATEKPRPVRLRGIVEETPVLIPARISEFPTAMPSRDRSVTTLRAAALITDSRALSEIPVAGRVRLDVQGTLPGLQRGAEIEILGLLSKPTPARNPGGFDFRLFLRERGTHTLIRGEFPHSIRILKPAPSRWLPDVSNWQSVIAARLRSHLSPHHAPLAVALLLGPRADISPELKEAFLQSGTVHFLAISGINVAILVLFLWPLVRATRLQRGARLLLIGLCVAGYVALTDADPPVVRAAVLVWSMLLSLASGRPLAPLNQLAMAALLILLANPHDLFQVGAQLSFLAILALQWLMSLDWDQLDWKIDPLDAVDPTWAEHTFRFLRKAIWTAFLATCAVWVFTLPLILARFHLVSPAGFLVNVLLPFWMTGTLVVGYVCLLCAVLFPPLLTIVCWPFDWCLSVFTSIVHGAAAVPYGHFKLTGPSDGWLAVFYVLIIAAGTGLLTARARNLCWRLMVIWSLGGLGWSILPAATPGLRCTFLAVGHGAAILIELPNRQTILYDAGSLEDGDRARQIIESDLLMRGKPRLDAIVISHPDIDHFNAVRGLMDNIPVEALFIAPSFLDFTQDSVRLTCEAALQQGVPVKLVWSGDRLKADPDVELQILQPPARGLSNDDNANSIVLSLRYAGRTLLLTGDLEKAGLQALLQRPPVPHDILLAPHHGSLSANPPDLARWAAPRWVVISGGGDTGLDKLQQNYGDGATLLSTTRLGAITFDISPQGEIAVSTQLAPAAIH